MHQVEYINGNLMAAYIGNDLLIVNNRTKNYYIERNPYLGICILKKFFSKSKDNYIRINKIEDYLEHIWKMLCKEVEIINNEYIIYIEITSKCNLRCKHCYNDSNSSSSLTEKELSIDSIRKVIENNLHKKFLKIILSGGEPTLHSQFKEILALINSYKVPITVYSNGINVMKYIYYLKKYNVNLMISLDGANENDHDYIRGNGNFRKTCHSIIELCNQLGKEQVGCAFTVNCYNYSTIEEMLLLCRSFGIKRVYINPVAILGRSEQNELELNARELTKIWQELCSLGAKYSDVLIVCDTYWKKELLINNQKIPCDCSICRKVRISADGDVFPCTFFEDSKILDQNIKKNSVLFSSSKYEEVIVKAERRKDKCLECIFSVFCNGGCAAAGYKNGKWGISETECIAKTAFFESCFNLIQKKG